MSQSAYPVPIWAIPFIAVLIMLSPNVLFRNRPWLFVVFTLIKFSIVLFAFYNFITALYLFTGYCATAYLLRMIK